MLRMQTAMDQISDKIVSFVTNAMETNSEDFRLAQRSYAQAMENLQTQLGEAAVSKEKEAIRQQIASTLLFSGWLGLSANLRRFLDPLTGNFLAAEPEIYLREDLSRKLPGYESAQAVREQFYAGLTPAQKEGYLEIADYVCCFETLGPRLAHYFGYLLGNVLLERVIPGYSPDLEYYLRYSRSMEDYFGAPVTP